MRHYLSTLHTRSDQHKKAFALAVSGGVTLSIFLVWSMVTFSPFSDGAQIAEDTNAPIELAPSSEVSPFQNLKSGVAASFEAVREGLDSAKGNIKQVDLQSEYEKVKTDTLNQNQGGTTVAPSIYGNQ